MVVDYGFPKRTYFEIFRGEHPSDKIYSVQVADWKRFFEYDPSSNLKDADGNAIKTHEYKDTAAVVQVDLDQKITTRADHLRVEPTADLVEFLAKRGIEVPDTIYVQPLAFAWSRDGEFDVESEIVSPTEKPKEEDKKQEYKNKALLALAVAIVSLLD